jgi:cardiolipin synthase
MEAPPLAVPSSFNLPNTLTLLRFVIAPLIVWLLVQRLDGPALALFLFSAASDVADGVLARRWNQRTRFGAVADPLADKTTVLLVVVTLTLQGSLPAWLAAAAVARDLLILGGALAFRVVVGQVEVAPSVISKLNTGLLFVLLLCVMSVRAGVVPAGPWLQALQLAALATIVGSGGHYVWVWGRKALDSIRKRRSA